MTSTTLRKIQKLIGEKIPVVSLPERVEVPETPFEEQQRILREIDMQRRKEDPTYQGPFTNGNANPIKRKSVVHERPDTHASRYLLLIGHSGDHLGQFVHPDEARFAGVLSAADWRFARIFTAGLVMLPFAWRSRAKVQRHHWQFLILTGLLGNAIPRSFFRYPKHESPAPLPG